MSRFVLLEHETDGRGAAAPGDVHWDLMLELERGALLATWRLARNPLETTAPIEAQRIGDHRRVYLDYEGELSGGRGRVRRLDRGELAVGGGPDVSAARAVAGAGAVEIEVEFRGAALRGRFVLRTHGAGWRFERAVADRT